MSAVFSVGLKHQTPAEFVRARDGWKCWGREWSILGYLNTPDINRLKISPDLHLEWVWSELQCFFIRFLTCASCFKEMCVFSVNSKCCCGKEPLAKALAPRGSGKK